MKKSMEKTKDNKELLIKKYKDMFLVLYRIFGGVLPNSDLKELCLKYRYFNCESTYYNTINLLESMDLIEKTFLAGSEVEILKVKQFAVNFIEGKRVKGVKVTKDRVIESCLKYSAIYKTKGMKINEELTLNDFYNCVMKETSFWSKEKSPVAINEWISSVYTLSEAGKDAVERGKAFEDKRNSNIKKDSSNSNVTTVAGKIDYTQKIDFSNLRNRGGFFNNLYYTPNVLRINTLVTTEEAPDFKNLGSYIYDTIYLASEHLEDINALVIVFNFADKKQLETSFNSCFEFSRDNRGIVRERRNLIDRINSCSRSNVSCAFKPYSETIQKENYFVTLKYKLRFGKIDNILDRHMDVYILFLDMDVYNKLYGAEKAEAMIAESKSRAEDRKLERKKKDAVVTKLVKLEKKGSLDKLETLVADLSQKDIDKLINFVKSL